MSANSPVVKRWFKRFLVAMGILAVGLIVGIFVITPPPAETESAAVVTENEDSIQRGIDASAARYTAMAATYAAENDGLQRGIDASAARYTAMAATYAAENDGLQRGIDASAARYSAMAATYAAENDGLQRGIDASAARYSAMAEYYAAPAHRQSTFSTVRSDHRGTESTEHNKQPLLSLCLCGNPHLLAF